MGKFTDIFRGLFRRREDPVTSDSARLDDGQMPDVGFIGRVAGGLISSTVAKELQEFLRGSANRIKCYRDYREMEKRHPMVGVALDMYADYSVNGGEAEAQETFQITMPDARSQMFVDEALERTRLPSMSWGLVRGACQYGDQFVELVLDRQGLAKVKALPVDQMYRLENEYGDLLGFIQQISSGEEIELEPWQIVHWRLMVDHSALYGRSVLYSGLRAARELGLVEDSATLARLTKGVMRYKWLVDVGGEQDPDAQRMLVARAKAENRHDLYMNKDGTMGGTTNMLRATEDIYVPKTKEGAADVEVLQGDKGVGNVSDLQHKRDALFMALRFPKSWYGLHGGSLTRADVDQSSINAFRAVRRTRNAFADGLRQIVQVALVAKKVPEPMAEELAKGAVITFPNITHSDVMLKAQIDKTRLEVGKMFADLRLLSREDILVRILHIPEKDATNLLKKVDDEAKKAAAAQPGMTPQVGPPAATAQPPVLPPVKKEHVDRIPEEVLERITQSQEMQELLQSVRDLTELVSLSHG